MPGAVDHTHEAPVLIRGPDRFIHRGQKQIRADDRGQFAVHIDGHRAYDSHIAGKSIYLHIREDQRLLLHRLLIPGAGPAVVDHALAALRELRSRAVVHHQKGAFRQRDKTGIRVRGSSEKSGHHIRHIGREPDPVRDLLLVDVIREDRLTHDLTVLCLIRSGVLRAPGS